MCPLPILKALQPQGFLGLWEGWVEWLTGEKGHKMLGTPITPIGAPMGLFLYSRGYVDIKSLPFGGHKIWPYDNVALGKAGQGLHGGQECGG